MIGKKRGISRKLVSIIIASMVFMAAAVALVIGINGYRNLENITRDNLTRANQVIIKQINTLDDRAEDAFVMISQHPEITEVLTLLSMQGPFYYEEGTFNTEIDPPNQIYSLKSQLELASLLKPIGANHKLSSIALYHRDVFNASPPAFSMKLSADTVEVAQYTKKNPSSRVLSQIDSRIERDYTEIFDISSIYELTLSDFLERLSASNDTNPSLSKKEDTSSTTKLVIIDNTPIIQTTFQINLAIDNPTTWETESLSAYFIVLEQQITRKMLLELKGLLDIDIALFVEDKLILNTFADDGSSTLKTNNELGTATYDKEYFSSSQKMNYATNAVDTIELELLSLSPVEKVVDLNTELFGQLFMAILAVTALITLLYFYVIAKIINTPLSALMEGVEGMAQGELAKTIKITSDDEMGQLAQAFNEMSAVVHEKNEQLKISYQEMKVLLDKQSEELELTQVQLIEAEKMSSIAELVAGVSHEVGTPLGVCITAQSFLIDETKTIRNKLEQGSITKNDLTYYIELVFDNGQIITSNLNRTAELIRNFKQVAVDQCIEDKRSFCVYNYIIDLLATLRPRTKTLRHRINLSGNKQVTITSLPGAMAQIITNLMMNSIIHGFDGIDAGNIDIEIQEAKEGIKIIYKDDGKGMPEESLAKVFDPFFTTRKGQGGTGLGMNIVYKLITDSLHGSIDCKSNLGEGVCFDIFIADQRDEAIK